MKYRIIYTKQFRKDLKKARKQGKNIDKVLDIIEKLARGEILEEKFRDHGLTGKYVGARECHVEPDLLLVYELVEEILVLDILRLGSHSTLFG